jgi:hypothetical protein
MLWCERSAGPRCEGGAISARRTARTFAISTLLLAGLTLSACGGDDNDATDTADAAATATETTVGGAADPTVAGAGESDSTTAAATTDPAPLSTIEPGDINETVAPVEQSTADPVAIDEPATLPGSITASITSITSIDSIDAILPGETAGPGVSITVEFANGSAEPLDLSSVLVDLVDSDGLSSTPMNSGASPFKGSLAAGESQSATYVFTIDEAVRHDVTIRLSYSADEPIVLFTGDLA